jgi:hypothetical protein
MQTMRILAKVDETIINTYFTQVLNELSSTPLAMKEDRVLLALELGEVITTSDGEQYAQLVKRIFSVVDGKPDEAGQRPVQELAIERVLVYLQSCESIAYETAHNNSNYAGDDNYSSNATTALIAPFIESEADIGPSLMTITAALACEYAGRVPVAPKRLLDWLSKRLYFYPRAHTISAYSFELAV